MWELTRVSKDPKRAESLWIAAVWLAAEGSTQRGKYLDARTAHLKGCKSKNIYKKKDAALRIVTFTPGLRQRLEPVVDWVRQEWPVPRLRRAS